MCEVCKAKEFAQSCMQAYLESDGHAALVFVIAETDGNHSVNFISDLTPDAAFHLLQIAGNDAIGFEPTKARATN